ncbi:MAG: ribonuclease III, partial [Pseudomonadales bacterium]|nr:ribonuclease III [Pseudomonadales bacterium]
MRETEVRLQERLGYRFREIDTLRQALTHRSSSGRHNNERLEFLGDSILSMVIAEYLYVRFPEAQEGSLTRLRASLVKEETLAEVARRLELGAELRLGQGEIRSGGFRRDSILADVLEAILAAVYLDSGELGVCRECVLNWFAPQLANLQPEHVRKDAKTYLQEWLQARHLDLPVYELHAVDGQSHEQTFIVQCHVVVLPGPVQGEGHSRRRAEQVAA